MSEKKRGLNWVDILLVLAVVLFVGRYFYIHYGPGKAINRQFVSLQVQFRISGLRGPETGVLRPGDSLFNTGTGNLLGTVTALRLQPVMVWKGGQQIPSAIFRDLYVTVLGAGQVTPVAVLLGGTQIHVGTVLRINSTLFQTDKGMVWGIALPAGRGK